MPLELNAVPTTVDEALQGLQVTAIRQLGDVVNRVASAVQRVELGQQKMATQLAILEDQNIKGTLHEMSERLRAVESLSQQIQAVTDLQTRVHKLEMRESERKGAVGLIGWINTNLPLLALIGGGVLLYFGVARKP